MPAHKLAGVPGLKSGHLDQLLTDTATAEDIVEQAWPVCTIATIKTQQLYCD